MKRRQPPETAAGYYVLHDFRRIDWTAWRRRSEEERQDIIERATNLLTDEAADEEGDVACFSVMGHKADLLILVLRPTMSALDRVERQLHRLELSAVTERTTSAVGVTEASGYTEGARAFFDEESDPDPGIERYMESRLYPDLPDAEFVSFYFMSKRREPEANWYDLPLDERAAHIERHGEIGREYAGRVTQMITGTTGFDDWEWGVTLFSNDMTAVKDLLVEMRFDQSTSRFAEFGPFYVGRQFAPADLDQFLAGEALEMEHEPVDPDTAVIDALAEIDVAIDPPDDAHGVVMYSDAAGAELEDEIGGLRENFEHYDSHVATTVAETDDGSAVVSVWTTDRAADTASGFLQELPGTTDVLVGPANEAVGSEAETDTDSDGGVRDALEAEGIYAGVPHGEEIHALVLYSEAETDTVAAEVEELSNGFDRYDTHEGTRVYESLGSDRNAVVSLWETETAAETASGYLQDLPGVFTRAEDVDGFSTMGMFYRVKPEYREDFRATFEEIGELLDDMDGHRESDLFVNVDDGDDMFIASHWRDQEDALAFFRSDAFSETVNWGRDVLADRPRHVFLT